MMIITQKNNFFGLIYKEITSNSMMMSHKFITRNFLYRFDTKCDDDSSASSGRMKEK